MTARMATSMREPGAEGDQLAVTTEDMALVMFETDQGASGSLVSTQIWLGRKNRLWFCWDSPESAYLFDEEQPDVRWIGGRKESRSMLRGSDGLSETAGRHTILPVGHPQGYQDRFNAFVADSYAAALGAHPYGLPTLEDGRRAAVLTEAVVASANNEEWVKVPA